MISQPPTDKRQAPPKNARSWPYLVSFVIAALVAAVVVAFFVIGLADGSVSSFNITLWLGVLAVVGVVLLAGVRLRSKGRTRSAIAVLSLLALPGLLYALFMLLVIGSGARWN
jgi:hypothetical protein